MKKRTHLLVTRHIVKDLNLSRINKIWLYVGVIFPDLTPMCLLNPHRYNLRLNHIKCKFNSLDFSNKNWRFFFILGYVSHYLSDFFTAPHNRVGIRGFCFNHRGYEDDLDLFFRDSLLNFKLSSHEIITSSNYFEYFDTRYKVSYPSNFSSEFFTYLDNLHKLYLREDMCFSTDFEYICTILYKVLIFCCSVNVGGEYDRIDYESKGYGTGV